MMFYMRYYMIPQTIIFHYFLFFFFKAQFLCNKKADWSIVWDLTSWHRTWVTVTDDNHRLIMIEWTVDACWLDIFITHMKVWWHGDTHARSRAFKCLKWAYAGFGTPALGRELPVTFGPPLSLSLSVCTEHEAQQSSFDLEHLNVGTEFDLWTLSKLNICILNAAYLL